MLNSLDSRRRFVADPFRFIAGLAKNQTALIQFAVAGGTSDAITATFPSRIKLLYDGLVVRVRAGAANTTITPTFKPDSSLAAHTITKFGGGLLANIAGYSDITAGMEMLLSYNLAGTRWELLNASFGRGVPAVGLSPINVTNGGAFVQADTIALGIYLFTYDFGGNGFWEMVLHAQFTAPTIIAAINFGSPGTRFYDSSLAFLRFGISGAPGNIVGMAPVRLYG